MKPTRLILFIIGLISLISLSSVMLHAQDQFFDVTINDCDNLEFLLARDITPYDLALGGGALMDQVSTEIPSDGYADFWSFTIEREVDAVSNITLNTQFQVSFSAVDGAALEFALYRGMVQLEPFAPVEATTIDYLLRQNGAYTVVVRRVNVVEQQPANYTLSISAQSGTILPATTTELREAAANIPIEQPAVIDGRMQFRMRQGQTVVSAHPDSIARINLRQNQSSQVFFPNDDFSNNSAHTVHLGNWVENMTFLGGDMAITGSSRVYFLENFDHHLQINGATPAQLELRNISYPDGTTVRLSWEELSGIWVLDGCVGFKLRDGRAFTAETIPDNDRVLIAEPINGGGLDAFQIASNSPDTNSETTLHQLQFGWQSIRADAMIRLRDGVWRIPYVNDRDLHLQSTDIALTNQPAQPDRPGAIEAILQDQEITIRLDWLNMDFFELANDEISLSFLDEPRNSTTRDGTNLSLFEALDDVIQIIYKDTEDGLAGEQRLLLPSSESYIEIITPAGEPLFDARALPGQPGYFPRTLNNTGAECYPVNSLLPMANCPPNGHINAANGNLWYSITDLQADGDLINLSLTRSYNSRYAYLDSPFGKGWTSALLPDFAVPFNPETNTRPIDTETQMLYSVGLDLTWAPRGIVIFTTPSGSRHQFVRDGAILRAVTMPGWTLQRDSLRSPIWRLQQDDGLTYEFDRAGRIVRYGYPAAGRIIEVDYPRNTIDGAGSLGEEQAVIVSDAANLRRLELYFDSNHHVVRSILRDMSAGEFELCNPAENCFETHYRYDERGNLVQVDYADGQTATYVYNAVGMISHDDPRAPIAPKMSYQYAETGEATRATIEADEAIIDWRSFTFEATADERIVIVTDELGNTRQYTYALSDGLLRAADESYTLIEETSPLAGTGDLLEDEPISYEWENGLLTAINSRLVREGIGRNGVDFEYTASGQIACIACNVDGLPQLSIEYEGDNPALITYSDGSTERFIYDEQNRIINYVDQNGADYALTWSDDPSRLIQVTRINDGVTWDYTYNDFGQIAQTSQTESSSTQAYIISYRWDRLGRLVQIEDSILGVYTVEYPLPTIDALGNFQRLIVTTDPVGAQLLTRFNEGDQIVEQRLEGVDDYLRRTAYEYDALGRLIQEDRWLRDNGNAVPLTTSYDYQPQPILTLDDGAEVTINGEALTITDPYGRAETTIYDALGRVRRTIDPLQRITDYDYLVEDTEESLGLRIEQQSRILGTEIATSATYLFDVRHQLRTVRQGSWEWVITPQGDTTRQRSLLARFNDRTVSLAQVLWGRDETEDYVNGRPTGVGLRQAGLSLDSDFNVVEQHRPALFVSYDYLGRPEQITTGSGELTGLSHCPAANGATRIIYGFTGDLPPGCDALQYQLALTYDVHGRLIVAEDAQGTRQFNYSVDAANQQWVADALFTTVDGQIFTWQLRYNGAGELVSWRDESGIITNYAYDTLGRLIAVTVPNQPEASYTFGYNNADMLVQQVDGLGRGFFYSYDELGRVTSKLNLRTADATSYSYTPAGTLASVITPSGNSTTYLYNDPTDTTRVTGIIQPTGGRVAFEWDDGENALIYTNSFNEVTRYLFDGTGLLWRIEDPLPIDERHQRTSELLYDDDGYLTNWQIGTNPGGIPFADQSIQIQRNGDALRIIPQDNTLGWNRQFGLTSDGQLLNVDDDRLRFRHDPLGRLLGISADGRDWQFAWQDGQTEVAFTTGYGQTVALQYDALYRRILQETDDGSVNYSYTSGERGITTLLLKDQRGGERTYTFSPGSSRLGTPPTITLEVPGQRMIYRYNAEGLLVQITTETCSQIISGSVDGCTDNDGAVIWRTEASIGYDALLRPVRISDENGNFETLTYNDAGQIISYQNGNGHTFTYAYDQANRLVRLTSATGVKLLLQYNLLDRITGICRTRTEASNEYVACVEAGGELEQYSYDALGRLVSRSFPNGETTSTINYTYDINSQIAAQGIGNQTVTFDYGQLGLLDLMAVSGSEYQFSYADLNRMASADGLGFTYDGLGTLSGFSSDSVEYVIDYQADQYTFSAAETSIAYLLDERGFLRSVAVNGTEELNLDYPVQDGVDALQSNGTVVSQEVDRQFDTTGLLYIGSGNVTLFNTVDAEGLIRRQNVTQPGQTEGYVVVYSYDNDERPITMRITDTAGLQVLYTQSFTYNNLGQLVEEIRRYLDGTQVIISREYLNSQQLAQQQVTIIRPLQAAQAASGILALGGLLIAVRRRPRWLVGSLVVLSVVIVLLINPLSAQQTQQAFTLTYDYDTSGNLIAINHVEGETVCRSFEYDSANRLTTIRQGVNGIWTYEYDAFNRLQSANGTKIHYQGGGLQVLAVQTNEDTYTFGQAANQPPYFVSDSDGEITWFITDGHDRILQTVSNTEDVPRELWLFDPFHRYLSLESPNATLTACDFDRTLPDDIPSALQIQSLQNGLIQDVESGLYWFDGRVYDPSIGIALQPNPSGVDVAGNLYAMKRTEIPFAVESTPVGFEGLYLLRDADATIHINEQLTAEAVQQQFAISLVNQPFPLALSLETAQTPLKNTVESLYNLPTWLETHYNLPSAYRHQQTGLLQLPTMQSDQQPFAPMPFSMNTSAWTANVSQFDTPILNPTTMLPEQYLAVGIRYTTYSATAWLPNRPDLGSANQLPTVTMIQTPDAVLDWLPETLIDPHYAAYALDAGEFLGTLPYTSDYAWIESAVEFSLPARPQALPHDLADWRQDWFRYDMLDVSGFVPGHTPQLPQIPQYQLGDNADWLHDLPD